jgi:uncharacterized membrane protein YqjE
VSEIQRADGDRSLRENRFRMEPGADNRSLGELFADLSRETSELVRAEVALARAELADNASRAAKNITLVAVGGLVAYAGLLVFVALLVIALRFAIPWWASTLIVSALVIAAGGFAALKGINGLKTQNLMPKQTVETIKEDAQWAKEQIKPGG